jgi:hypothetical protein
MISKEQCEEQLGNPINIGGTLRPDLEKVIPVDDIPVNQIYRLLRGKMRGNLGILRLLVWGKINDETPGLFLV